MSEAGQAAAPAAPAAAPAPAAADPISRIQAMLESESAPPPKEPGTSDEPDYVPDGSNRKAEGEDAPQDEQTEQAAELPAMAEIPLDQLEAIALEVTIKGDDGRDTVEKPTIKELREGFMRQKDYQRKTAEVARQREEVGEKVRQGIESERTQYLQNLQLLQATLIETTAPELKNVDWNALAQSDAFEYVRLQNRAQQIQQAIGSVQAKIKEVTDKHSTEQATLTKQRAAKARETLQERIPNWNDQLYQNIMKSGEAYGFKSEEVGAWLDPRSIEVLHDAMQYRQMKQPAATKKVAVAPKVLKPGSTNAQGQNQQRNAEAFTRLQKSGSIRDAASIIQSRMR